MRFHEKGCQRVRRLLCCLFLFWTFFLNANIIVEANIQESSARVNFPLKGIVTITHDSLAKIDPASFELNKEKLNVSFVKNIELGGGTRISIYSFTLPPQEAGLHTLESILVKVNEEIYRSQPTPYWIIEASESPMTSTGEKQEKPTVFTLEAFVQGPSTLYLADRTTLVYRIAYNRSIDLTQSDLPFMHIHSFLKVGDAQVTDQQEGELTIQTISQTIEASQLGTFTIGPSAIEGYAYFFNHLGQKIHAKPLLRAEAAAIQINVIPFPEENRPASFNGAIGKISAEIKLNSPNEIKIGNNLKLQISLSGVNNLSDLQLPALSCQPGISGLFQVNDLPLAIEIKDKTKVFYVDIRPIASLAAEIPSLEFSSFNLDSKQFDIVNTPSIPIKVIVSAENHATLKPIPAQNLPSLDFLKSLLDQQLPPIKQAEFMQVQIKQIPFLQRGWVVFIIPLGLLFLLWQIREYRAFIQRPQSQGRPSALYFAQAQLKQSHPMEAVKFLEKAIWSYLNENGIEGKNVEELPKEGKSGMARTLIMQLLAFQYSPEKTIPFSELLQRTKTLLT